MSRSSLSVIPLQRRQRPTPLGLQCQPTRMQQLVPVFSIFVTYMTDQDAFCVNQTCREFYRLILRHYLIRQTVSIFHLLNQTSRLFRNGNDFPFRLTRLYWDVEHYSHQRLSYRDVFADPKRFEGLYSTRSHGNATQRSRMSYRDAFAGPERFGRCQWLNKLQYLRFENKFNSPIEMCRWPQSLLELRFGWDFNQSIEQCVWPASLRSLSFDDAFNQSIKSCKWPDSLTSLSFGWHFNQPIEHCKWPVSLTGLTFGWGFNQPIEHCQWPNSLQDLWLDNFFNQPIGQCSWPDSLRSLSFGDDFNQPIEQCKWPNSLQSVTFGLGFDQPIEQCQWPASLQRIEFPFYFTHHPTETCAWLHFFTRTESTYRRKTSTASKAVE